MTEAQLEGSEAYARFALGFPKPETTLPIPEQAPIPEQGAGAKAVLEEDT